MKKLGRELGWRDEREGEREGDGIYLTR